MMELTTWLLQFLGFAADLGYAGGDSLEKPTKPRAVAVFVVGFWILDVAHLQKGTLDLTETTPMIKEPMSSFQIGKQAGENTLKKELWTKFEAATAFDEPILEDDDPTKKGFLDRLDEALDS
ncbi:general substrate transporter [Castilleja foliolosa]|uniref:General substrate transporter n=1 Tax=Castilleja foliolosa TaxID=1961234 RepID=A0ABD3E2B0_9LAMI